MSELYAAGVFIRMKERDQEGAARVLVSSITSFGPAEWVREEDKYKLVDRQPIRGSWVRQAGDRTLFVEHSPEEIERAIGRVLFTTVKAKEEQG